MAQDLASLGVRVDTAEVRSGKSDLDGLTASAERTQAAAAQVGPAYQQAAQQVKQTATAARSAAPAQAAHSQQMGAAALSAKQYSQAMRLLPAQITDVVTGLASGQTPFLVAIQQGGQLRDMFGGVGAALRAVATVITPARLAIGGAVGIVTLLAKAYNDAKVEAFDLSKSIILSGNAAGVTSDELTNMARSLDGVIGTQKAAAAVLTQLAASGQVSSENLESFAETALRLERTVGQPVEETVKALAELGRKPVEAALKYNESLNFLTASTYRNIKSLQEQGKLTEAGAAAQRAYSEAMTERSDRLEKELGLLQRIARGTGDVFKEMWDSILDIGRPDTLAEKISQLQTELGNLDRYMARFPGSARASNPNIDARRAALAAELDLLKQQQEEAGKAAAEARKQKEELDKLVATEKERVEVAKLKKAADEESARQQVGFDIAGIQRALDTSLAGFQVFAAHLDSMRDADLVSETEYYAAKRALVAREAEVRAAALEAESNRVRQELQRLTQAREQAGRDALATPGGQESDRIKAEKAFNGEIAQGRERLKDLEAELLRLRQRSASEIQQLSISEVAAANASQRAITDARNAASDYLDTLERANDRRLAAFGQGSRAREIAESRNSIDDRFAGQRNDLQNERARLESEGKFTAEARRLYEERLAIIEDTNRRALDSNDAYYSQLAELEGNFWLGAHEGMQNFIDDARNVAVQSEQLFTDAFQGMTDALVDFAMTGKLDFKSLANSIIADLLRIQIQAALVNAIGGGNWFDSLLGLFGGGGGVTGNAATGLAGGNFSGPRYAEGTAYVPRDQIALVHKGEAVIPAKMNPFVSGRGLGGPSVTIHQTLNPAPGNDVSQVRAVMRQAKDEAVREVYENLSKGRWAGVAA